MRETAAFQSVRTNADPQDGSLLSSPRPKRLAHRQLQRTLAHIEANLGSKLEIRHLASLVALSKSHFCRCFKHSLGVSPIAYVLKRRLARVKSMMLSRKERLSEIALACGFADQPHLNRSFRDAVGVSPGRWRRLHAAPSEPESGRHEGLSADALGATSSVALARNEGRLSGPASAA
jgi:transcriptional regulator GlxA family with amidase domain